MEPESDQAAANTSTGAGEELSDAKATEQSPATSEAEPGRRALRGRGVGRQTTGASAPDSADTNGAIMPSPQCQSSGRVLRDPSLRTMPAWLQSDQISCDQNSSDDDPGEAIADSGAIRRRKVACPRRKKKALSAAATTEKSSGEVGGVACLEADDPKKVTEAQGQVLSSPVPSSRRAPTTQARAKAPSTRPTKGTTVSICKSEPDPDCPPVEVEAKVTGENTVGSEKKEEEGGEVEDTILENEDPSLQDDPKDLNFQLQLQRNVEEEQLLSSDEDVPFTDDLTDQSYDPSDPPKARRKPTPRQREKKEKVPAAERKEEGTEERKGEELHIKMEGGESIQDVKLESELEDEMQEPRKRGRRRKDDKTPRLPKRRKKPPVQYVRCEMEGCGTVLAHPRYLQHHIKYQHLLKKKYVCPHPSCGRLFRLQKQLLRHAKHHTDQRDYICEFCARAFKSSHNLAVHRMIHTGEKPIQCEICGFTCRQKASLNWHMKKHDADATYQFSCSICGKKFEKKDSVVAHKAKSHPEVLIAEALAANAGALITTPVSLLEAQGISVALCKKPTTPEVSAEQQQVRRAPQVSQARQGLLATQAVHQAGQVERLAIHATQLLATPQAVQQAGQVGLLATQAVHQAVQQVGQVELIAKQATHQEVQQAGQIELIATQATQQAVQQAGQVELIATETTHQAVQQAGQIELIASQATHQEVQHTGQVELLATQATHQAVQQAGQGGLMATQTTHQVVQQAGQVIQVVSTAQPQQTGQINQQMGQVSHHQVVLLGQDQSLHTMQVPVTIALSPMESTSSTDQLQAQLQLQMPLQFIQTASTQLQPQQQVQQLTLHPSSMVGQQHQLHQLLPQSYQPQQTAQLQTQGQMTQILHMTFQPVSQTQQIPVLTSSQQLHTLQTVPHTTSVVADPTLLPQEQPEDPEAITNGDNSYVLSETVLVSADSPSLDALQTEEVMDGVGGVWEEGGEVLTDGTEGHMQHTLI